MESQEALVIEVDKATLWARKKALECFVFG